MEDIIIEQGEYCISTENFRLDLKVIHHFLSEKSYWSKNIPLEKVQTAIENSLNFGVYYNNRQIGYARVITDFSTIAYLGDVFIIEEFRGQGLSKWLMNVVMTHPDLQGLRRWILLTGDAHGLYEKYGWTEIENPEKWMELHNKEIYKTKN